MTKGLPEAASDRQHVAPLPSSDKGFKEPSLCLKIDGVWYDLTQWQHVHPGGHEILKHLHQQDATDAFFSLHSTEARARLQRLPKAAAPKHEHPTTSLDVNFRKLRARLERDGWFDRNPFLDALYIGAIIFLVTIGWLISSTHPWIATLLIGVGMEQAGWVGHDYTHGRGKVAWWLARMMGGGVNGFSTSWWSDKHNTHHVYPNTVGIDRDIANDPVFHLWIPESQKDHALRKYQHLYFLPVCSFLYASWRLQSFQYAWATRNYFELAIIAFNYSLLATLPWPVAVGSILFGGFLVGVIVTATHQSEDLLEKDRPYDFVRDQFLSTRNAYTNNAFLNWFWGGMQYQLEHHLFPTMPKYRYGAMSSVVREFAKQNKIEYREDGAWEILVRNMRTMYRFAQSHC